MAPCASHHPMWHLVLFLYLYFNAIAFTISKVSHARHSWLCYVINSFCAFHYYRPAWFMNYMILQLKLFSLIEIIPSGDEWGSLLDFLNYVFDSLIILFYFSIWWQCDFGWNGMDFAYNFTHGWVALAHQCYIHAESITHIPRNQLLGL